MNLLHKRVLGAFALLALGSAAHASDVTVTVNIPAFSTGPQVAQLFESAWSQSGDFGCNAVGSQLTATDLSGDCDEPFSRYTFAPQINSTKGAKLRIQCSATSPSFEFDGGGFVPLVAGANVFTSGPDSITVTLFIPSGGGPTGVPSMSEWALIVLALLVMGGGVWILRRAQPRATPLS